MDLEICQDNDDREVFVHENTTGGRRMKQIYWKCVDCQSMITDANMHDSANPRRKYTEFCYGCMSYGPEVVLAYD